MDAFGFGASPPAPAPRCVPVFARARSRIETVWADTIETRFRIESIAEPKA